MNMPDIRPLILIMLIQKRQIQRLTQMLSVTLLLMLVGAIWFSCLHMAKRDLDWLDPLLYLMWSMSTWVNASAAWKAGRTMRRIDGAIAILQAHLASEGGNSEQLEGVVNEAISL